MALITTTPSTEAVYYIGDVQHRITLQIIEYDEDSAAYSPIDLTSASSDKVNVNFQSLSGSTESLVFDVSNSTNGEIQYDTLGTEFSGGDGKYKIQAVPVWTTGKKISTNPLKQTPEYLIVRSSF